MWPYWLMFLIPAWVALGERAGQFTVGRNEASQLREQISWAWWGVIVGLTLLIGWRHEVGGDWFNYLEIFQSAFYASQFSDWWWNDPGYRLLEWLSIQTGWGIYGVNLLAGALFSFGLVLFCRGLPRPWLALAVAVPYLVIILGMGYSRQGVALACVMAGLVALGNGRIASFVLWAVIGATFHKSAVLLLPMAALAASRRRWVTVVWVTIVTSATYIFLLQDSVESLTNNYVDAEFQSEGALVRLTMNALPAVLFLWNYKRFAVKLTNWRLWLWFALASLVIFCLYFLTSSSTALDRVALYLLPLQLMVFSYLPEVFGRGEEGRGGWVRLVILYYFTVQFVWLNFANNAPAWLPYRWFPLI